MEVATRSILADSPLWSVVVVDLFSVSSGSTMMISHRFFNEEVMMVEDDVVYDDGTDMYILYEICMLYTYMMMYIYMIYIYIVHDIIYIIYDIYNMIMMIGSGSRLGHMIVPPGFTIVEPWIRSRSLLAEVGSRIQFLSRGNPQLHLLGVKKAQLPIYRGYNSIYNSRGPLCTCSICKQCMYVHVRGFVYSPSMYAVCAHYIHAIHIHASNTYDGTILLYLLTQDTHREILCV